jgi:hypothetical protein
MYLGDMNPWLTMWSQPRATMNKLIHSNPKYGVLWLATIYALQGLFYFANIYSFGTQASFLLLLAKLLIIAPPLGIFWLYCSGWILSFTGKWLGGKAPALYLRMALAWSTVPLILSAGMWLLLLLASPNELFLQSASGISLLFVNLIAFILGVWSFILFVQALSEVQGFTLFLAFLNIVLYSLFSFFTFFIISYLSSLFLVFVL